MASIFAEKRPESSSRVFDNQTGGNNGKSMPAVPALQKQGAPGEEEPAMMKATQLKSGTVQKEGAPADEEPTMMKSAQLKSDTVQKEDGEEEEKPAMMKPAQLKSDTAQKEGGEEEEKPAMMKAAQLRSDPAQKKSPDDNKTGLPDNLKTGVEQLSGHSLSDVKVHYNSSRPAQLNALAYAQGTDIHVAPGQEKHLPHEAWHVAQQKQGRVQPTTQAKGVPVNDDKGLESEADTMGTKAAQMKFENENNTSNGSIAIPVIQNQRAINARQTEINAMQTAHDSIEDDNGYGTRQEVARHDVAIGAGQHNPRRQVLRSALRTDLSDRIAVLNGYQDRDNDILPTKHGAAAAQLRNNDKGSDMAE